MLTKLEKTKLYSIKTFCILCMLLISIIPLFSMITKITSNDFSYVINDKNFVLSLSNSAVYSFISATIVVMLSVIAAYLLNRSNIKHKSILIFALTLPLLIPSLSIGLGIKCLFGVNGFLDKLFHIKDLSLGFPSLILCSTIALFPTSFMIIYDALQYEDKSVYDASDTLGIPKLSSFFKITLPYLKVAILYAFIVSFSIIFSDYGIPMETAGMVKTLPMYLYESTVSSFEYGRASICAICMLIPSIASFIINLLTSNSNSTIKQHYFKASKTFNIVSMIVLSLISLMLFVPEISFSTLAFVKSFPNNMTITLQHFVDAFSTSYSLSLVKYIKNSLILATLTGLFGTIFAYILAYFSTRFNDKLSKIIDFIAIMSLAIPGMVLGICYIFTFAKTKGWFYNTMTILIVVNIAHMMGSAYVIAKNCLLKQNKDYEMSAKSLGISNFSLFCKVLVPNSKSTFVSMFSYFFVNSMTTVTAILFLSSYLNQPLSVMITIYDRTLNYEMQATISVMILVINIFAKMILTFVSKLFDKQKEISQMNRQEFNELISQTELNDKQKQQLSQYKVKRAIILAAGFGTRLVPVTLKTPKPLVSVNGETIVESLIKSLRKHNIEDITIVVGYKKEQFDYLIDKYNVKLIENPEYNTANNISSLYVARHLIDRCYICEADLLINNFDVIQEYEYETCYLGFYCKSTDDWCAKLKNGKIKSLKIGGEDCYQTCGISYWSFEQSMLLKNSLEKLYTSRGGKENIWDNAAFGQFSKGIKVGIRPIEKQDVIEIDTFEELCRLDKSYKTF